MFNFEVFQKSIVCQNVARAGNKVYKFLCKCNWTNVIERNIIEVNHIQLHPNYYISDPFQFVLPQTNNETSHTHIKTKTLYFNFK